MVIAVTLSFTGLCFFLRKLADKGSSFNPRRPYSASFSMHTKKATTHLIRKKTNMFFSNGRPGVFDYGKLKDSVCE